MYFTGADTPAAHNVGIGLMLTPRKGNVGQIALYARWAADNDCFNRGEQFDLDTFLRWLADQKRLAPSCQFAVAPDVVGNAAATLTRSRDVLPIIRNLGYPAAFVAQDGLEGLPVPWESFDVLFIGGSTAWKLSAHALHIAAEAKRRGKGVHMGRVNSLKRLIAAAGMGCDSVDGTMLAFKPDARLAQLLGWLNTIHRQPTLSMWEGIAA